MNFFLCFTPFFDRPQLLKCSRVHLRILVGCIFPWKAAVCLGRACFLWMCPDIPKRRIICRSLDKFLNDHQWRALLLRHRRICLPWLKIRTCFLSSSSRFVKVSRAVLGVQILGLFCKQTCLEDAVLQTNMPFRKSGSTAGVALQWCWYPELWANKPLMCTWLFLIITCFFGPHVFTVLLYHIASSVAFVCSWQLCCWESFTSVPQNLIDQGWRPEQKPPKQGPAACCGHLERVPICWSHESAVVWQLAVRQTKSITRTPTFCSPKMHCQSQNGIAFNFSILLCLSCRWLSHGRHPRKRSNR